MTIKEIFFALRRLEAKHKAKERKSIEEEGDGRYIGYKELLKQRYDLAQMLSTCELKIKVPKEIEKTIK